MCRRSRPTNRLRPGEQTVRAEVLGGEAAEGWGQSVCVWGGFVVDRSMAGPGNVNTGDQLLQQSSKNDGVRDNSCSRNWAAARDASG